MNAITIRPIAVRACVDPIQEWAQAERERSLLPIAGVAQDEHAFHIDTCVPKVHAGNVRVDAFPTDILIETLRDGQIERFTRLRLSSPIDPARVRASMRGM